MKIAVCDDDQRDLKLLEIYCRQFDPEIPVAMFSSGEALLEAYRKDFYDIVFLDIELGRLNGLEAGKRLAGMSPKPIIVFTTHSSSYAVRGYGIAMRYLTKPIAYDTFSAVMKLALEQILPRKIIIISNGIQRIVPIGEILYFEVLRHQLFVHLKSGESLSMRRTLAEVIEQIPCGPFAQPHKSYYINMEYVDRLTQQNITMTNGDLIPISRSRKNNFQLRLNEYMEGNRLNEYMD